MFSLIYIKVSRRHALGIVCLLKSGNFLYFLYAKYNEPSCLYDQRQISPILNFLSSHTTELLVKLRKFSMQGGPYITQLRVLNNAILQYGSFMHLFVHSFIFFIHSFFKYLLSAIYAPGSIEDTRNTVMNKHKQFLPSWSLHSSSLKRDLQLKYKHLKSKRKAF